MWTLLSHLKDASTANFTKRIVYHCLHNLLMWSDFGSVNRGEVSFHLPLHRNLAMFIRQGLLYQGIPLEELLPSAQQQQLATIAQQIVRLQSIFYQILGRLWSRNGTEILNQAESYVNSLCCNSMIDADIFLLQAIAGSIPKNKFISLILDEFQVYSNLEHSSIDPEEQNIMIESCLLFCATLTSSRINLGMSDENLMAVEMSTLLCKGDKLHSELMELLPERCGSDSQLKNFEKVLAQVADFQAPHHFHQGKYVPKATVWENLYDPIHTLMRSSNRSEFQVSLDRYQEFVKRSNLISSTENLWPPFRINQSIPLDDPGPIPDPQSLLTSNLLLEVLFVILFRAVHMGNVPNFTIALSLYLIEMAISSVQNNSMMLITDDDDDEQELNINQTPSKLSIYPGTDFVSNLTKKVNLSVWLNKTYINKSVPEESIISLLLQLYVQLQENSANYTMTAETITSSGANRIGDGAYFVANLLNKLASEFPSVHSLLVSKTAVQDTSGEQREEREREERRKRAKERKLQLMTELAMKRQQFMKMNEDANSSSSEHFSSSSSSLGENNGAAGECEFECVICMEKGGSKFENPYGLITYLMPTSVLSHRKSHDPYGPVGISIEPFGTYWSSNVYQLFGKHFDEGSIRLSLPLHGGIGVSIQSCGHYLHTDCFNSYMNSLNKSKSCPNQRDNVVQLNHRKFFCPLCRQLGNSFLPIIKDALGLSLSSPESSEESDENELVRVLRKRTTLVLSPKQKLGVEKFLDDVQKIVTFTKIYEVDSTSNSCSNNIASSSLVTATTAQALSLVFLNALELESLKCKNIPNLHRSYILPLYSVLRYSYKSLPMGHSKRISQVWEAIVANTARPTSPSTSIAKAPQREVPLLLRDLNVVLVHLMLQLPYGTEKKYLKLITRRLLMLKLAQILTGLCVHLDHEDLISLKSSIIHLTTAAQPMIHIIMEYLSKSSSASISPFEIGQEMNELSPSVISSLLRNPQELDNFITNRMRPFVKKVLDWASIVSRNPITFMNEESHGPFHNNDDDDLHTSLDYFGLIAHTPFNTSLSAWLGELLPHRGVNNNRLSDLFMTQLISWEEPALKEIPTEYDKIFQSYRKLNCNNCNSIPSEPALCLLW